MNTRQHQHTYQSLEYRALLSGLSMIGDSVSDKDIAHARRYHEQNSLKEQRPVSFVSIASVTKHSVL